MKSEKLYYTKLSSPETLQVIVTAEFAGVNLELNEINKKYDPVNLVTKQGVLSKTNAILRYLTAGTTLNGSTPQERNQLNTWYEFFNTQLLPLLTELYAQVSGEKPTNEAKYKYCIAEINNNLKVLDESLKFKTFFVGSNLTLFDITLTCYLDILFKLIITEAERKKLINLFRWYHYVRAIPIFTRHLENVVLCGKDSFKLNFIAQTKTQPQGQTKPEQKKQGEKPQAKTETKKQKKVQQKTQGQQKQEKKPEPVQTKLDEFKRLIKSGSDLTETLKIFLENFEKQNFSVWKIQYNKGQQQGKDLESAQNLLKGTLQKIQNISKVAFGTWGVYGEQGNYNIQGVMIWKGKGVHPLWKRHPSLGQLKFTQLQTDKEEDRAIIVEYITEAKSAEGITLQSLQRVI